MLEISGQTTLPAAAEKRIVQSMKCKSAASAGRDRPQLEGHNYDPLTEMDLYIRPVEGFRGFHKHGAPRMDPNVLQSLSKDSPRRRAPHSWKFTFQDKVSGRLRFKLERTSCEQ